TAPRSRCCITWSPTSCRRPISAADDRGGGGGVRRGVSSRRDRSRRAHESPSYAGSARGTRAKWTTRCRALTSRIRCGRLPLVERHVEGLIIEPTPLKPGLAPAPDVKPLRGKAGRRGEVTNRDEPGFNNPLPRCCTGPARATARAGPFYDPDRAGEHGLDGEESEETGCRACA